jgi:hypothetical protein
VQGIVSPAREFEGAEPLQSHRDTMSPKQTLKA